MSAINTEKRELLEKNMAKALPVLRARLNMTQAELADRIGITRQTLIKLEAEKAPVSWISFLALYTFFNSKPETGALLSGLGISTKDLRDTI
jgi:DNA-binding XRE family transcriptional regulator